MMISEIYNDILMKSFLKAFKEYQKIEDETQVEIMLKSLLKEEDRRQSDEYNWGCFKNTCKALVQLDGHDFIIRFIYGVFMHSKKYDMEKMQKVLSEVQVNDEWNLADMCSEFFLYTDGIVREEDFKEPLNQKVDMYHDDITQIFNMQTYSSRTMVEVLPEFLCEKLYGYSLKMEDISTVDVDNIVHIVLNNARAPFDERQEYIEKKNKEIDQHNKKLNGKMHLGKHVADKVTEFDLNSCVPGALLSIFKAADILGKTDICYYILEKYALSTFAITPWKQTLKAEVQLLGILFGDYADFISDLFRRGNIKMTLTKYWFVYDEEMFFAEASGKNDGMFIKDGVAIFEEHPMMGTYLANIMKCGKEIFKREMPLKFYSFLMACTPYMLYCSNCQEQAATFLVNHFDEIAVGDKRMLYFKVVLIRCILATTHLETANILYGYYNYEMDRQERDKKDNFDDIENIVNFMYEAKEYIRMSEEYTITTQEAWFDILYKDGRIDALLENIKTKNDARILISEYELKQLLTIVCAYAFSTGINLGMLNLPRYDGYDKLEGALSCKLLMQAKEFEDKIPEYKAFYESKSQLNVQKNVNIILQHHISKLMDATLEDSVARIKELKENFLEQQDTVMQAEMELNENQQDFLQLLDEICENLMSQLLKSTVGRPELENYICNAQERFISTYCSDYTSFNLVEKLPLEHQQEVNNYLVTAELVYRMLSVRNDKDQLDFSPALISLTKAMEVVLNYIYSKMEVQNFPDIDSKLKSSYFEQNSTRKRSIEFGPCVYLFKDGKFLSVTGPMNNRTFSISQPYSQSHFNLWKGNDVVDISKLRSFKNIDVKVNCYMHATKTYTTEIMQFDEYDDHFNRMLFAKGLEYVKDNYRNKVAHKETIALLKVEECKDLLLLTENLMWIMLYILK